LRKVAQSAGLEVLMESSPGHQVAAGGMMGMRSIEVLVLANRGLAGRF